MSRGRGFCAALAATLIVFGTAAGCGDDKESGEPTAASGSSSYCALSNQLDQAGTHAFSALESNPNATDAQYQAAERRFVEQNSEKFDRLIATAPASIQADVKTLVAAQRGMAGAGPAVPQAKVQGAEQRVKRYEASSC